jgi:hypothetical protein
MGDGSPRLLRIKWSSGEWLSINRLIGRATLEQRSFELPIAKCLPAKGVIEATRVIYLLCDDWGNGGN